MGWRNQGTARPRGRKEQGRTPAEKEEEPDQVWLEGTFFPYKGLWDSRGRGQDVMKHHAELGARGSPSSGTTCLAAIASWRVTSVNA